MLTFVDCVQTKHNPARQVAAIAAEPEPEPEPEHRVGWISGARGGADSELEHRCEWIGVREVSWGAGVDPQHIQEQWAAAEPALNGRWILANKRFKAQISGYKRGSATLTFEGFNGIPDPDDGTYDLLGAEIDWEFSSAPK